MGSLELSTVLANFQITQVVSSFGDALLVFHNDVFTFVVSLFALDNVLNFRKLERNAKNLNLRKIPSTIT